MLAQLLLHPLISIWTFAQRYAVGELSLPVTTAISVGIFLVANYLLLVFEFTLHLLLMPNSAIVSAKASLLFAVMTCIHVAVWQSSAASYTMIKLAFRLLVINNSIATLIFLLSSYGLIAINHKTYIPNPNVPRSISY